MRLFVLFLLFNVFVKTFAGNLSPISFGFYEAKNGIERYNVLLKTHNAAIAKGVDVDYKGLPSKIEIEIPKNSSPIKLTSKNDFCGITFVVVNVVNNSFLFTKVEKIKDIQIKKDVIDSGNFRTIKELSSGNKILIIYDTNPWGGKRKGYDYSPMRKDIIYIHKGVGVNNAVKNYNNKHSNPKCFFRSVNDECVNLKNIKFIRSNKSTFKTDLLKMENLNNIEIDNVYIETPTSNLYADAAITINNCTNVIVNNVMIDGTYSLSNKYGYGISLNNVYNVKFQRLVAKANWGIFGNNNLNKVELKDCNINRFDIHSYGKDVTCRRCIFHDLYNQFSSFYGILKYDNCTFQNFIPVLLEDSYNAYTKFDLILNNCEWNITEKKNYLINAGKLGDKNNSRAELEQKYLPNIYIKNLSVNIPQNVDVVYLYRPTSVSSKNLICLSEIKINGLNFVCEKGHTGASLKVSSADFKTKQKVKYILEKFYTKIK